MYTRRGSTSPREPLEPGKVYEPPQTSLQAIARNHLRRPRAARIALHCDASRPSWIELPITRGSIIGTFFSGGDLSQFNLSR